MCFVLYLGTRQAPPITGHARVPGRVCTEALPEPDHPVRRHFSLPVVTYVGSDQGCGCGFRHGFRPSGAWSEEYAEWDPDYDPATDRPNHDGLVEFLRHHCAREPFVELYGCWNGDFAEPEEDRRELKLAELAEPMFHFHERGYCRVRMPKTGDATPPATPS